MAMFGDLSDRLSGVFDKLKRRGALKEADVAEAMREIRVALLEADVALPVVKDFIEKVKEKAVGQDVVRSVTPGQMVVKIVHDALVETLGGEAEPLNLNGVPPVVYLMVGLQGSGKTTTTAKIAKRLMEREKKRVLMASLDTRRPAAQEQLKILGEQNGIPTLPVVPGQAPLAIAKRAVEAGRLQGHDVVILDTAGRMHVDADLMAEVIAVRDATAPLETLLVADSLTGQDAVNVARAFHEAVNITGAILTRMDGDGRGGAALSLRAVTGQPVKLIGTGEKIDALEAFHPGRIAGRILGMGDVVSLVEKAAETIEAEEAERIARKMQKGQFDLDDLLAQLRQMKRMGGMKGVLGLLPGVAKMQKQMADARIDDKIIRHQEAILLSMTAKERRKPEILNASRKRRIAKGAGVDVSEINRLLKQHLEMQKMMKRVAKMGGPGGMLGGLFGGKMPSPEEAAAMMENMPKGASGEPGSMPGLGGPSLPAGPFARPGGQTGLPGGLPPGFDPSKFRR